LRFTGCPLHRFIIVCPLPRHTGCRFGQRTATCATLVPASRFLTTLLAFSTRCAAGLLHPANGLEVRSLSRFPIPAEQARSGHGLHPTSVCTPRRIPLIVAVPHHCGLSLLGVVHDRAGTHCVQVHSRGLGLALTDNPTRPLRIDKAPIRHKDESPRYRAGRAMLVPTGDSESSWFRLKPFPRHTNVAEPVSPRSGH